MERGESDICITRLVQLAEYYKKPLQELIPNEYQNREDNHKENDSSLNGKTVLLSK